MRHKEALQVGLIQRVTVALDRETIAWFKAQTGEDGETGGTRWLAVVSVHFHTTCWKGIWGCSRTCAWA